MFTHCSVCAALILPADGPSLLWAPADTGPREAFHLCCWLAHRASQPPASESRTNTAELAAA